jgi:hypothetical protein
LLHTGRWEGELGKSKADASRVVVASRWSLRQDEKGRPVAQAPGARNSESQSGACKAFHGT